MHEIKFKEEYKSITNFNSIVLPQFTVLTGVNGSGKTHLLQSILSGKSSIGNIPVSEIKYFDFTTFFAENEQQYTNQQIDQERIQAWNKLSQNQKRINFRQNLEQLKNKLGSDYSVIEDLATENDRNFLQLEQSDFKDQTLYTKYINYKQGFNSLFTHQNIVNDATYKAIKILSYKIPCSLDSLSEDEFKDIYVPFNLKNDFIPTQLSRIFLDYKYKQYRELVIKKAEAEFYCEKTKIKTEQEFESKYGPKPWVIIEEILQKFTSLDFELSNPDDLRFRSDAITSFNVMLQNKTTGKTINFSDLSSGERVIFALVISIYKTFGDRWFPKVLLLDEIDATLHPSMVRNLIDVILEVFVKDHDVIVLLATHSPTTIALSPEESIYVVNRGNKPNKITKESQGNSLSILTEGFMSLEHGLTITDQVARKEVNIFTEGNNVQYLQRAIDLLIPKDKHRIQIISDIGDRSGVKQLEILYDFFLRLDHNNHIIFVYDCDVNKTYDTNTNTSYHVIPKNISNHKFEKGIENAFPEQLILGEHYVETRKKKGNGEIVTLKTPDKKRICQHITQNAVVADYDNFKDLINLIKDKLKNNTQPSAQLDCVNVGGAEAANQGGAAG